MKSARPHALRALLAALALAAALVVVACGETKDENGGESTPAAEEGGGANPSAEIPKGLTTVSIPKQLGNPYEEFEHSGIDEALEELGGSNSIKGPTDAGASTQIPIINAAAQGKPAAIIIAGNDPDAVAPALKQAAQRGVKVVGMDSDVAADARSVFVNQVTTQLVGENQVESIGKQIGYKGDIAILSATANATNQNAWIAVMKETLKKPKYKDMKLVKVAYGGRRRPEVLPGDPGPDPGVSGPQGHHLAHHRRRRRGRALPVDLAAEGQARADRPRLPEPDAQVRQERHRRRVPALGPEGRRLPRGAGGRGAGRRSHHRQGGREVHGRPARQSTRSARTARSCSAR